MEPRPLITRPHDRQSGFTLIELLVVLLLLTITIGLVGINLGSDERDRVHEEAGRLAVLLQAARDEAILEGRILAVQFNAGGYRFLQVNDKGKLVVLDRDDTFRPRQLPSGMSMTLDLDGVPAANDAGLLFEPSGNVPPFVLTLRLGQAAWLTRHDSGRIRAEEPGTAHAL